MGQTIGGDTTNHVGIIEVKSDNVSLDLYIKDQVRNDRCIPNCIITTDTQGNARLPIVNYSTTDVIVKENERISRAVLCTEVQTNNHRTTNIDLESIKHGDQLTDKERMILIELITKYKDCFATNIKEIGMIQDTECEIVTLSEDLSLSDHTD